MRESGTEMSGNKKGKKRRRKKEKKRKRRKRVNILFWFKIIVEFFDIFGLN